MQNSKIEWCHHTFNPWRGCAKVSVGCDNCYAESMAKRNPSVLGIWGEGGTRVVASETMWRAPLKWDFKAGKAGERHRVFCASMADVFEDRPELVAPRRRLFDVIGQTPNLDWLLLTKRPENILRIPGVDGTLINAAGNVRPNCWLGTSVENQEQADKRIPHLLRAPAAVRFISAEPLLGPVDLWRWLPDDWSGGARCDAPYGDTLPLDWVIAGGESGPHARSCAIGWFRDIQEQCRETRVAFFMKQLGSQCFKTVRDDGSHPPCRAYDYRHPKGGDWSEWPKFLQQREFPEPI